MKKHILVISQYFYPEQFRINDICKELVNRGFEVTVVTGIPNYPQGKFYKGYGLRKRRNEEYKGIHIIRLPIIPRGNGSIMMILNYFSFVLSGFVWKMFTQIKADKVFIFEVSPMTQALVGVWYAKKRKIPCHIYVQDLWPENVEIVTGIQNKTIIGGINLMVDYIYNNCTKILATSPSFIKQIGKRKLDKKKLIYWPQYAEEFYRVVPVVPLKDMKDDETFKIVFTGNIGYAQGLDILPNVALLLKEKNIKCRFCIIGDGRYRKELEQNIQKMKVTDMFKFFGTKLPEEIPQYLAHCQVAFLSFADNPLFEKTIPAKLQSYMACGIPILASASGETKRIIEEAKAGVVCKLGDSNQICDCIIKMTQMSLDEINSMRENAVSYFNEFFNKKKLMDELESYFNEKEET